MLYVILGVVLLAVSAAIYAYVVSNLKEQKIRSKQEILAPKFSGETSEGQKFNVYLTSGNVFLEVSIIGVIERGSNDYFFANWDGILIVQTDAKKKIYIRKSCLKYIEEA
jgi:hypothetical protein